MKTVIAYIGIGSNMGDKLQMMQQAVQQMVAPDLTLLQASSLYETAPVDYLDQDLFYNAVLEIQTRFPPQDLIKHCQKIEQALGKNIKISKGPRTIDLDLLFYSDYVMDSPDLTVPHPGALKRGFVLSPMAEIAPDYIPPNDHRTIREIADQISDSERVQKKMGSEWANHPKAILPSDRSDFNSGNRL
ncbi:MAG: 2-amino-4-hydroxy-6-hydroxymethyldihydropteridine diphosphokinase [Nitrospirota bacterium]